jgi:hypothetical protein
MVCVYPEKSGFKYHNKEEDEEEVIKKLMKKKIKKNISQSRLRAV